MAAEAPPELRDAQPTVWTIGDGPNKVELVQDKLTFFEKNEFLGIVARAMDNTLQSGGLQGLFGAMSISQETLRAFAAGDVSAGSMVEAADMVTLMLKLIGSVPDLLEDAYMVVLSIDPKRRESFRAWMRVNLDDETGFGIFETFIVQNERTLRDFLPQWIARFKMARETLYPELGSSSDTQISTD
jgi:hypothetical protein